MEEAYHQDVVSYLLIQISEYVVSVMRLFGVPLAIDEDDLSHASGVDSVMPYLQALVDFRAAVRALAKRREEGPQDRLNSILRECDSVRDKVLPALGVRLEDSKQGTEIKFIGRAEGG